jgi:hypothetical protein
MKLQFSLATLLVCMTVLAVVCAGAASIRVREPLTSWDQLAIRGARDDPNGWLKQVPRPLPQGQTFTRPPNLEDIVIRMTKWAPAATIATLTALWSIRRLKSRRENGPPGG